jgi:peptidoglycan/LPS O-acetylase OafA/YrhL
VLPTLPNGGWSITVEFHFYLLLPVMLWLSGRWGALPLCIVFAGLAFRSLVYTFSGDVAQLSYQTIVGRIDQFALGIVACRYRHLLTGRHLIAIGTLSAFMLFYWAFDSWGGMQRTSSSPVWVVLPTIEGVAYAAGIAWYDSSFRPSPRGLSGLLGRLGEYSYSIYLLHFFVVFKAARLVNDRLMPLSNFYVAWIWSMLFAIAMMVPAYLSYRFLEAPFLKLRRRYLRERT